MTKSKGWGKGKGKGKGVSPTLPINGNVNILSLKSKLSFTTKTFCNRKIKIKQRSSVTNVFSLHLAQIKTR